MSESAQNWEQLGYGHAPVQAGLLVEVLLETLDGFMQNCDLQLNSFRAYLLEFLQLQVSGIHKPFFSRGSGPFQGVLCVVLLGGGPAPLSRL